MPARRHRNRSISSAEPELVLDPSALFNLIDSGHFDFVARYLAGRARVSPVTAGLVATPEGTAAVQSLGAPLELHAEARELTARFDRVFTKPGRPPATAEALAVASTENLIMVADREAVLAHCDGTRPSHGLPRPQAMSTWAFLKAASRGMAAAMGTLQSPERDPFWQVVQGMRESGKVRHGILFFGEYWQFTDSAYTLAAMPEITPPGGMRAELRAYVQGGSSAADGIGNALS